MDPRLTPAASALATLLALGVCGSALAQVELPRTGNKSSEEQKGPDQVTRRQQLDIEKATLKDQVNEQINAVDANIDVLKKMSDNAKDPTKKKKHEDMQKQLSDARSRLEGDLEKIDTAKLDDWNSVRPAVRHHIAATNNQLQRATAITKVPVPPTGAANRQPPSP
jgi:TolA-binding protein